MHVLRVSILLTLVLCSSARALPFEDRICHVIAIVERHVGVWQAMKAVPGPDGHGYASLFGDLQRAELIAQDVEFQPSTFGRTIAFFEEARPFLSIPAGKPGEGLYEFTFDLTGTRPKVVGVSRQGMGPHMSPTPINTPCVITAAAQNGFDAVKKAEMGSLLGVSQEQSAAPATKPAEKKRNLWDRIKDAVPGI